VVGPKKRQLPGSMYEGSVKNLLKRRSGLPRLLGAIASFQRNLSGDDRGVLTREVVSRAEERLKSRKSTLLMPTGWGSPNIENGGVGKKGIKGGLTVCHGPAHLTTLEMSSSKGRPISEETYKKEGVAGLQKWANPANWEVYPYRKRAFTVEKTEVGPREIMDRGPKLDLMQTNQEKTY